MYTPNIYRRQPISVAIAFGTSSIERNAAAAPLKSCAEPKNRLRTVMHASPVAHDASFAVDQFERAPISTLARNRV